MFSLGVMSEGAPPFIGKWLIPSKFSHLTGRSAEKPLVAVTAALPKCRQEQGRKPNRPKDQEDEGDQLGVHRASAHRKETNSKAKPYWIIFLRVEEKRDATILTGPFANSPLPPGPGSADTPAGPGIIVSSLHRASGFSSLPPEKESSNTLFFPKPEGGQKPN